MLKVKGLINGELSTYDSLYDKPAGNYVLEFTTTETYLENYGEYQYKYVQDAFNTTSKLDVLCRYVWIDEYDDCGSSSYFVVCINGQYLLLEWGEPWMKTQNKISKLDFTNIDEVHKYVLSLY